MKTAITIAWMVMYELKNTATMKNGTLQRQERGISHFVDISNSNTFSYFWLLIMGVIVYKVEFPNIFGSFDTVYTYVYQRHRYAFLEWILVSYCT